MRDLSYDVFFEPGGILKSTIADLFDCNEFLYQRKNLFVTFSIYPLYGGIQGHSVIQGHPLPKKKEIASSRN